VSGQHRFDGGARQYSSENLKVTWSPILLVPFIAIVVLGIVLAVALASKQPGVSVFTLLAVLLFGTGACLGFLLTNFSSPTAETWWWALAARVGWTCGGALMLSLASIREASGAGRLRKPQVWVLVAVLPLVGALLCLNPIRDLVEGPLVLEGSPTLAVGRTHNLTRGGGGIWATLALRTAGGAPVSFDFVGWGASEAEAQLSQCAADQRVRVSVLPHVERVLSVECR
jgi:hypothetical protein